jgi:hypothetical protein
MFFFDKYMIKMFDASDNAAFLLHSKKIIDSKITLLSTFSAKRVLALQMFCLLSQTS